MALFDPPECPDCGIEVRGHKESQRKFGEPTVWHCGKLFAWTWSDAASWAWPLAVALAVLALAGAGGAVFLGKADNEVLSSAAAFVAVCSILGSAFAWKKGLRPTPFDGTGPGGRHAWLVTGGFLFVVVVCLTAEVVVATDTAVLLWMLVDMLGWLLVWFVWVKIRKRRTAQ